MNIIDTDEHTSPTPFWVFEYEGKIYEIGHYLSDMGGPPRLFLWENYHEVMTSDVEDIVHELDDPELLLQFTAMLRLLQ